MKKIVYLAALTLLMACQTAPEVANTSNEITIVESNHPESIFPGNIIQSEQSHVITQVHDGLLGLNPKTETPEALLAKRWFINNESDVFTFQLYQNIYFHDDTCFEDNTGRQLMAEDVKKSFEYLLKYKHHNQISTGLLEQIKGTQNYIQNCSNNEKSNAHIDGIVVKDSFQLEIHLKNPNPNFIYSLVGPDMVILPIEGLMAYGENCTIGCGPFQVDYFKPNGDSIVLTKNQKYYRTDQAGTALPYTDRVIFYYEPVPAKSLKMIRNGVVKFIPAISKKHVLKFVEENITLFEEANPTLSLEQPIGLEKSDVYMIRHTSLKNLRYSSMNLLYLDRVYLKSPEPTK
ncbi:MAG: ABC transporter substrate-binding protein [Salinivirgaceae bacterium]|nr:ABC transporter substrate-binding protein [Salinivirgaceae bacterium]